MSGRIFGMEWTVVVGVVGSHFCCSGRARSCFCTNLI